MTQHFAIVCFFSLCCFVNGALCHDDPHTHPASTMLNLALCHTILCVVCHLAARGWGREHKSRGQRVVTVRDQSKCKRATFLGACINSPVDTLFHLLLSRKPQKTRDNKVTFFQKGLSQWVWERSRQDKTWLLVFTFYTGETWVCKWQAYSTISPFFPLTFGWGGVQARFFL